MNKKLIALTVLGLVILLNSKNYVCAENIDSQNKYDINFNLSKEDIGKLLGSSDSYDHRYCIRANFRSDQAKFAYIEHNVTWVYVMVRTYCLGDPSLNKCQPIKCDKSVGRLTYHSKGPCDLNLTLGGSWGGLNPSTASFAKNNLTNIYFIFELYEDEMPKKHREINNKEQSEYAIVGG